MIFSATQVASEKFGNDDVVYYFPNSEFFLTYCFRSWLYERYPDGVVTLYPQCYLLEPWGVEGRGLMIPINRNYFCPSVERVTLTAESFHGLVPGPDNRYEVPSGAVEIIESDFKWSTYDGNHREFYLLRLRGKLQGWDVTLKLEVLHIMTLPGTSVVLELQNGFQIAYTTNANDVVSSLTLQITEDCHPEVFHYHNGDEVMSLVNQPNCYLRLERKSN